MQRREGFQVLPAAAWGASPDPRSGAGGSERRRQSSALLLSLLIHGLLLSLSLGGHEFGLPGLGFPWRERRVEVPAPASDLRVALEPPARPAVELRLPPAESLPPQPAAVSDAPAAAGATAGAPMPDSVTTTTLPPTPTPTPTPLLALAQPHESVWTVPAPAELPAPAAAPLFLPIPVVAANAASAPPAPALDDGQARERELELARHERRRQEAAQAQQEAAARLAALQAAEAERQLAAEREAAAHQSAEARRLEAERREATQQAAAARAEEAARQAAPGLEAARQAAAREARLKAIGRLLDEEAAQRDAAAAAARQPPRSPELPTSLSSPRRGRLFGRIDANAELLAYAEAMSRKIQLNLSFEPQLRDLLKQPHTDPVVTIAVRSDGSVEAVVFQRSSGVPGIDEAVRRMVQSQANYPAFAPLLARDYDVIEIRRTWHFDSAVRLY